MVNRRQNGLDKSTNEPKQKHASPWQHSKHNHYPLKVEYVFLECFPGLSVCRLVGNVGVFFVSAALVVLAAVRLPV